MPVNRLSGMVSGMDTETMVKNLMKAENYKMDKLKQQKQITQWKRQAFLDTNSKVYALKSEAFNMKLTSNYKSYQTNLASDATIKVNAAGDVVEGVYKVTVDSMATSAYRTSTSALSNPLESSAAVTDLNLSGKVFDLTYNGVKKSIGFGLTEGDFTSGGTGDLVNALQQKINNAFGTNQVDVNISADNKISFAAHNATFKPQISVSVDDTLLASENALTNLNMTSGQASQISINTKLSDLNLTSGALNFEAGYTDFDINGINFKVSQSDTLGDVISKINANKDVDVTASYDYSADKIILKRKSTGDGKDIAVVDNGASDFMSKFGLADVAAFKAGTNAKVTVVDPNNTILTNVEMPTNSFTLKGISINIMDAKPGVEQVVSITKNVDSIFNTIKDFVTQYNDALETLNKRLSEEVYKNYQPLTDDERAKLTPDQITQWEEKAKSGIVKNDSALSGIVVSMRNTIMSMVQGLDDNSNSLPEIGLTNVSYNAVPKDYGKLQINETKLRQAISENLDGVIKIFTNNPPDVKGATMANTVDVEGKNFMLNINGSQADISLTGSYDITTDTGKSGLLKNVQDQINNKYGIGNLIVTMSNSRLTFISPKGYSYTLNSGSNDALSTLGLLDNTTYNANEKGVASKLYDKLNAGIDNLISKAGASVSQYDNSILGKQLYNLDSSIIQEQERLTQVEDRYNRKFAAMETALNKANSQSAWLSQQLGGGK